MISTFIRLSEQNITLICGNELDDPATKSGIVGHVFGIAQISGGVTSPAMSDTDTYPYFSRVIGSGIGQMLALIDTLLYYSSIAGPGWTDVAIISSNTNSYGLELADVFLNNVHGNIRIVTYQQYLVGQGFDTEMKEIQKSGARVILPFVYVIDDFEGLMKAAVEYDLVGDHYVWGTSDALVGSPILGDSSAESLQAIHGMLGLFEFFDNTGTAYHNFIQRWVTADPEVYPSAGPGTFPTPFPMLYYDQINVVALAIEDLYERGMLFQEVSAEEWVEAIRSVDYEGVTGHVTFKPSGDRDSTYSINYYNSYTNTWEFALTWKEDEGVTVVNEVVWFSNSTDIPDLDIRPPFDYWSCYDKKHKKDPTGKRVKLHTPDRENVDEIEYHYHCDGYIDCYNLSDESIDCSQNYEVIFIVFGIVIGILILLSVMLLIFVIVFGMFLKYLRIRASSPFFLILTLVSIIIGFLSVFAWFGKPHPISCVFQPWLLGLSSISMISALCVKTFRIWRIFKAMGNLKGMKITDYELLVLWAISMVPALVIILTWTIVSTPTAKMKECNGEHHYVCTSNGFTGEIGGYIFFAILVAYGGFVLLIGAVLSILTRKVPSLFNESKLLAISIYNLVFLSAVIIPVFLVIQTQNPFAAWILRTVAILYAFSATLCFQFVPPVFCIIFVDRFRKVTKEELLQNFQPTTTSQSFNQQPPSFSC